MPRSGGFYLPKVGEPVRVVARRFDDTPPFVGQVTYVHSGPCDQVGGTDGVAYISARWHCCPPGLGQERMAQVEPLSPEEEAAWRLGGS